MNDEFLHALRRDPPAKFASELQRRLDWQSTRRRRVSIVRTMVGLLLIGSVAMAAALLLRDRREASHEDAPIAQAATLKSRAGQPANTSAPSRPVTSNDSAASQPEAQESAAKDIPVALATSSLARPLAEALLGRLSKYGYFAQPRVMTTGDYGMVNALCGNTDFLVASRRISDAELALCRKWGIDIVEWQLGYQAVVLTAGPASDPLALTPRDVFLALARRIPDPSDPSRLIDNPNLTWHDVDARFDNRSIDVLVQADDTTLASFLKLLMEPGCETYLLDWRRANPGRADPRAYEDVCHQLRGDDRYREVDMSSTFIKQALSAEPNRLVVLGYPLYAAHRTQLLGTMLEGPAATLATLTDGTYPAARPVYVYAQRSHLDWNPAARTLATELTSEDAVGPQGYLLRLGLVTLQDNPRRVQKTQLPVPPALESLQP